MQRYFKTRSAAVAFCDLKEVELLNDGRKQGEFTDSEKRAIYRAREITERLAAINEPFSLEDALDHFESHLALCRTSITVNAAYDEFIERKEQEHKRGEIGSRHLSDLQSRLRPFTKKFGRALLATLSATEVEAWLNRLRLSAQTRINYKLRLQNFIGFCLNRKYLKEDPLANIKRPTLSDKPVEIFSVDEASRLLANACDKIRPSLAIGLFTGLRAAEIEKLDWSKVNLESMLIEVVAKSAKTKRRRLVEISANLAAWLAPLAQQEGPVAPTAMVMRTRLKKAMTLAKLKSWPSNGLRHSFASYHYAFWQSADRTASMLGHSDTEILFAHYRELVSSAEAEKFWQIMPME